MLQQDIQDKLKEALREKNERTATVLRSLVAAIHQKEIDARSQNKEVTEDDVLAAVQKEAKKRKEAAVLYKEGGRDDLVAQEEAELDIIEQFLPAELSDEEIEQLVQQAVEEAGDQKDFGTVMKLAMQKIQGRAGGDRVSAMVKQHLG
jgi:hypothetical protein